MSDVTFLSEPEHQEDASFSWLDPDQSIHHFAHGLPNDKKTGND
jgi:hypothetical protein